MSTSFADGVARPRALLQDLRLHHVSIAVTDMDQALAWYARVFGAVLERRFRVSAIRAEGAFIAVAGLSIELWCAEGAAPVPAERRTPNEDLRTAGCKHLALTVVDLSAQFLRLIEAGVTVIAVQRDPSCPMQPPAGAPQADAGPVFAVFIADPFGTLIELIDRDRARQG